MKLLVHGCLSLLVASIASMVSVPATTVLAQSGVDGVEVSTPSISLSKGRQVVTLTPGDSIDLEYRVKNRTDETHNFDISPTTLTTPTSSSQFAVSTESLEDATGAGLWLDPEIEFLEVAPDGLEQFTVRVTVPDGTAPGTYAAGINVVRRFAGEGSARVNIYANLQGQIVIAVPGDIENSFLVEAGSIDTWHRSGTEVDFRFTIENTGQALVRVQEPSAVHVDAFLNTASQELELPPVDILPTGSRAITVTWSELPLFGTYTPSVTVHVGSMTQKAEFGRIWILPPWWLWLSLAGAIVLAWVGAQRMRDA